MHRNRSLNLQQSNDCEQTTENRGNPEISFIIAAYNVQEYISDAVSSALNQRGIDVEVIVVDDCSTDDTWKIITNMQKADSRLVTHRTTSQRGPSAARNLAIRLACGEWIAVLDGDDFVDVDRSRRLVNTARAAGATLIADHLRYVYEPTAQSKFRTERKHKRPSLNYGYLIDKVDYIMHNRLFSSAHNLGYLKPIFNANFVKSQELKYDESLRIGEDFIFCLECITREAKFLVVSEQFYSYRVRANSLSWRLTLDDIRALRKSFLQVVEQMPSKDSTGHLFRPVKLYQRSLETAERYTIIINLLKGGLVYAAIMKSFQSPLVWALLLDLLKSKVMNRRER